MSTRKFCTISNLQNRGHSLSTFWNCTVYTRSQKHLLTEHYLSHHSFTYCITMNYYCPHIKKIMVRHLITAAYGSRCTRLLYGNGSLNWRTLGKWKVWLASLKVKLKALLKRGSIGLNFPGWIQRDSVRIISCTATLSLHRRPLMFLNLPGVISLDNRCTIVTLPTGGADPSGPFLPPSPLALFLFSCCTSVEFSTPRLMMVSQWYPLWISTWMVRSMYLVYGYVSLLIVIVKTFSTNKECRKKNVSTCQKKQVHRLNSAGAKCISICFFKNEIVVFLHKSNFYFFDLSWISNIMYTEDFVIKLMSKNWRFRWSFV